MASLVNLNSAGFKALANGEEMRGVMRQVGEKAKGIAEGLSQDFQVTGEYAHSFEVVEITDLTTGRFPGPRAGVRLLNSAPYAVAVEYGYEGRAKGEGQHAHRVLGRTLDALENE